MCSDCRKETKKRGVSDRLCVVSRALPSHAHTGREHATADDYKPEAVDTNSKPSV